MKIALILFLISMAFTATAQKERKFVRGGNELYNKQDFEKAEVEYRKALDKQAESYEAAFNLGDALYKQKKYDEALQQFVNLAKQETNPEKLGELYHNIGNTLLSMEKTDESIEAYKESLRNRPGSEETKYNLEFARHKKQQNQQDQNKDQNKDRNKEQQQQPNKISKEDAQRLLEALQNDEKKVQEKVQKEKVQQQKAKK